MTTSHANCDHLNTKGARAACRKERYLKSSTRSAQVIGLVNCYRDRAARSYLASDPDYFLLASARKFGGYTGTDAYAAADSLLTYFLPSGDADVDARRRANGYTVTDDFETIRSLTTRSFS